MDHSLPHVNSRYGAPMGRRDHILSDKDQPYQITIRRVVLDQGGYDIGGAYWGTGMPLWRAFNDEGLNYFFRAVSYAVAVAEVIAEYPHATIQPDYIDEEYRETFIDAYMDCAIWASHSDEDEDRQLDGYSSADIHDDTRKEMADDCNDFINTNAILLASVIDLEDAGQAGHDFWLTRNGHGAGFWDRGLGDVGRKLSDAARVYGERYLYLGDDEMIHQD